MGHARCAKRCVLCEAHCVLPVHEEVHAAAHQGFHHKAVVKVIETASCIYAVSENSRFSSMKEKDFSSKIDVYWLQPSIIECAIIIDLFCSCITHFYDALMSDRVRRLTLSFLVT